MTFENDARIGSFLKLVIGARAFQIDDIPQKMDKLTVREKFGSLVGESELKKFVMTLHNKSMAKGRLLFWQEEMWKPFAKELGLPESDLAEIRDLFLYCPVHTREFENDHVPVINGTFVRLKGEEEDFPFANDFVLGVCWEDGEKVVHVQFCPDCRVAKKSKTGNLAYHGDQ